MHPDAHLAGLERAWRPLLHSEAPGPVEHELAHAVNLYDGVPAVHSVSGMTYDRAVDDSVPGGDDEQKRSEALFDLVERQPRLSDKVASMMLETILSRRLRPGDRLPSERELGEQFGVSRTVIREAVRALVTKGVIEVRSGSGLRVAAVEASAVRESMSLFMHGGGIEFHRVIARATHNELFLMLMDSIGTSLIDIRRENLGSGAAPETLGQHER